MTSPAVSHQAQQRLLHRFNPQASAASGNPVNGALPLQTLERLTQESVGVEACDSVKWEATAQLRAGANGQVDTWLRLRADTSLMLTCQRCMGVIQTPLLVDQWYRFVESEEVAMRDDDACEEDLLVTAPEFDLAALLEDELLMALPLVPMHQACPALSAVGAAQSDEPAAGDEKPNPFAVLAQLKR